MFDGNRSRKFEAVPSSREEVKAEIEAHMDEKPQLNHEGKPIPTLCARLEGFLASVPDKASIWKFSWRVQGRGARGYFYEEPGKSSMMEGPIKEGFFVNTSIWMS